MIVGSKLRVGCTKKCCMRCDAIMNDQFVVVVFDLPSVLNASTLGRGSIVIKNFTLHSIDSRLNGFSTLVLHHLLQ
jgi:hypothetical protein